MKNRVIFKNIFLSFSLTVLVSLVQAQELTEIQTIGKNKYEQSCAPCHAEGRGSDGTDLRPAPAALTIKYRGSLSPYITQRPELGNVEVLRAWVRTGTVSMPPFRKSELTDDELMAIAAYFTETSK